MRAIFLLAVVDFVLSTPRREYTRNKTTKRHT
jgi:hypothetical protein